MKKSWVEYGLSAFLVVALLRGFIQEGLSVALLGWVLVPAVFWVGFYWHHYWGKQTRPLTRADKILGTIAWGWAVSLLLVPYHQQIPETKSSEGKVTNLQPITESKSSEGTITDLRPIPEEPKQPTLTETERWMENTTVSYSIWKYRGETLNAKWSFDGCKVVDKTYSNSGIEPNAVVTFSLSDLDPRAVKVLSDGGVLFETTNNADKVILNPQFLGGGTKVDGWAANLNSKEHAQRFGKALRHAIELCGGQGSTF